jgi:uncharacterized membrane protein YoaK (UPF0700 family)
MANENETLRWPTNLDRAGIEKRLVQVRELALRAGLADVAGLFSRMEKMSAAQIGGNVIAALNLLQERPEHHAITKPLEMVAMNLKNLKGSG